MGQQRQSVEKLFGDALVVEPEARSAFLDAACHNDPDLKHLVEQLLMADERAGSFLEKPPFDFSTKAGIHSDGVPLTRGTRLGPYEILALVGAGGMGEVYRARDTRLGRDVAVKILSTRLSMDPDLKRRFEREARAVSSLTHPNICCLYDIGSQDGIDFIVMEYLEGETLADRLTTGLLPLQQALKTGVEIADALDKAHREGIIHRDLKPGNIMLDEIRREADGLRIGQAGGRDNRCSLFGFGTDSSTNDKCDSPSRTRRPVYGARDNHGHAPLHGSRNHSRSRRRRSQRYLQLWLRAVRDGIGEAAV